MSFSGKMKVLQVNSQLRLGGAETVMHQLHDGLHARGHQSQVCVAEGSTYPREVLPLYPRLLSRLYHSRFHEFTERYYPRREWTDRNFRRLAEHSSDLLHLHNFHGNYASVASLAHVAARKKMVWTFHALWGITGGCDHPGSCGRYQDRCGTCPQLGQWPVGSVDHTAEQLKDKLTLISGIPLHIVAPSRWLAGIVAGSQVGRGWHIHNIPNGVDPAEFGPGEHKSNMTTILIVNRDFSDSRKGYPMVKEALSMIDPRGMHLVLAGQGSARAAVELSSRFDCQDAGYVRDRLALAALYASADIFLFASEAENFPCVILEAMASECCVVATPTGGVVEQIENGRSGILAAAISGNALGDALRITVADAALRVRLGKAARKRVIENFSEERMVNRYFALYEEVLDGS